VEGFKKLLLTASASDNTEELQKMLNEFVDLARKTKIANDVVNEKKTEESK
jgi:mannitol/fructose-specific phosphotransferase system IIA component (Ntr-type)